VIVVLWVLRVIRRLRSLRRRALGAETPHWAKDVYRAIKYVNIFELIPTLVGILFAPRHFFRHLDLIITKRKSGVKSVYRSPIGLTVRTVVLVAGSTQLPATKWLFLKTLGAFPSFLHSSYRVELVLVALLASVPLLVPIVCGVLIVFGFCMLLLVGYGDEYSSEYSKSMLYFLLIPLEAGTYKSLDWGKVGWAALYFCGYLITFPIFTFIGLALILRLLFHSFPFLLHPWTDSYLVMRFWGLILLPCIVVIGRVVAYPYIALLIECRKEPTDLMLQAQISGVRCAIVGIGACHKKLKKMSRGWRRNLTEKQLQQMQANLKLEWTKFERWWRREVVRRRIPPEQQENEKRRVLSLLSLTRLSPQQGGIPIAPNSDDLISRIAYQSWASDENNDKNNKDEDNKNNENRNGPPTPKT
jgi:hypothetical protein